MTTVPIETAPTRITEKSILRGDIQGLRAISVLVIVLFHLDLQGFSGGFVGVDIFMVISGFLITGSLLSDHVSRTPARVYFLPFWDRRIRRLFPALFVMLAFCFVAGWLSLRPGDYDAFALSSLYTLFYTINFHLTAAVDYFDADASLNYLLHTWSLALEEQFYILLPIALYLLRHARSLTFWLMLAWVASLTCGIAVLALGRGESYAFYLLPARAWEFLTGSLIALHATRAPQSPGFCGFLGATGLLMIGVSVVLLDEFTPFPGIAALLPVFGTALVIFSGTASAGEDSSLHRLLGWGPLSRIGDMSYSIYLFHWPVAVFARHLYGEEMLSPQRAPVLIIVIFSLSWLSWRFVETPFRSKAIPARRFYGVIVPLIAMISTIAIWVQLRDGLPNRVEREYRIEDTQERQAFGSYNLSCTRSIQKFSEPSDLCSFGDPDATGRILLWGDSHAGALLPAMHELGLKDGFGGRMATLGGCVPVPGFAPMNSPHCGATTELVLGLVLDMTEIDTVILHARWSSLFGLGPFGAERVKSRIHARAEARYSAPERRAAMLANLTSMIFRLQAAGKRVIIVGPVPEVGLHALDASWVKSSLGIEANFMLTRHEVDARQALPVSGLQKVAQATGAMLILPSDLFCGPARCEVTEDNHPGGRVLYKDDDHLSILGATRLAREMKSLLE